MTKQELTEKITALAEEIKKDHILEYCILLTLYTSMLSDQVPLMAELCDKLCEFHIKMIDEVEKQSPN